MNERVTDEPTEAQASPFFSGPKDLSALAREQGVKPFAFDEFMAAPTQAPEDESADEVIAAVRQWRREGKKSR